MPAKRSRTTSISDAATDYARSVASGTVIAGPLVRLSCARHLDDLENGPARGLYWDLAAADHAIGFFYDVLRIPTGPRAGLPFDRGSGEAMS